MVFLSFKPIFSSESLLDISMAYQNQFLDDIFTSIDNLSIDQGNPTLNFTEQQMI